MWVEDLRIVDLVVFEGLGSIHTVDCNVMCLTNGDCKDPTEPGVWWRDDAEWKRYDATHAAAIQRAVADGASRVELGSVVSSKYGGGGRYAVDFTRNVQINLATGYERRVKFVTTPGTPGIVRAPADDKYASIIEEHQKMLQMIQSLKDMVLKNQADLADLRAQVEENTKAKPVVVNVTTTYPQSTCCDDRFYEDDDRSSEDDY